jgi:hypothetical protein
MAGYIFCPFPLPPPLWGRTQMRGEPRPFPPSQPSPAQGEGETAPSGGLKGLRTHASPVITHDDHHVSCACVS